MRWEGSARRHSTFALDSLISEFAGRKQMPTLQDAQTVGHRNRVKVLDIDRPHVLVLMLYRDLEEIPIFALQQEEETAL